MKMSADKEYAECSARKVTVQSKTEVISFPLLPWSS
jgi:hypothetical protein